MESFITMDSDGDTLYWVECSDDVFIYVHRSSDRPMVMVAVMFHGEH